MTISVPFCTAFSPVYWAIFHWNAFECNRGNVSRSILDSNWPIDFQTNIPSGDEFIEKHEIFVIFWYNVSMRCHFFVFFPKRLRSASVSFSSESDRPISTSAGSINQTKLHIFQWGRSLKLSDSGHQFQFRSPNSSQNPIHFNQNRFFSQNLLKFLASKSFQVLNKC